jgi:hypothetical protein
VLPGAYTCEAGQFTLAGWLEPAGNVWRSGRALVSPSRQRLANEGLVDNAPDGGFVTGTVAPMKLGTITLIAPSRVNRGRPCESTRSVEDDVRFVRGFAQPGHGVAQDAGDVHLRAAHALADLALHEVLREAQADDLPRPTVEHLPELG